MRAAHDWTPARAIWLWKWSKEDAGLAAASTLRPNRYDQMAAAKLAAIERKLREVPTRSGWCFALASGVPDSDRVYGSAYLARHPEMQEGS